MYFTYDAKNKIYELRNNAKSCVKKIKVLSLVYDTSTYLLEEYGEMYEIDQRLQSLAKRKIYSKESIRSDSWDLEYLNKLMSGDINFYNIDQGIDTDFAIKFMHTYYRCPRGY